MIPAWWHAFEVTFKKQCKFFVYSRGLENLLRQFLMSSQHPWNSFSCKQNRFTFRHLEKKNCLLFFIFTFPFFYSLCLDNQKRVWNKKNAFELFETAFRNKQNKILTKKKKNNDVETHCANVQLVTRSFFPSRRCAYSEFNRRCCACITWKRIINSRANWHEKSLSERGDRDLWTMNNNRPILFLLFLYSIEQKKTVPFFSKLMFSFFNVENLFSHTNLLSFYSPKN